MRLPPACWASPRRLAASSIKAPAEVTMSAGLLPDPNTDREVQSPPMHTDAGRRDRIACTTDTEGRASRIGSSRRNHHQLAASEVPKAVLAPNLAAQHADETLLQRLLDDLVAIGLA